MKRKLFTEMLNSVGLDRSFRHLSSFGLCSWVFNTEGGISRQTRTHNNPDTLTGFGILCHFHPTDADMFELELQGHDIYYWGSESYLGEFCTLTNLRATIMCFCAAINNEL